MWFGMGVEPTRPRLSTVDVCRLHHPNIGGKCWSRTNLEARRPRAGLQPAAFAARPTSQTCRLSKIEKRGGEQATRTLGSFGEHLFSKQGGLLPVLSEETYQ